MNPQNKSGVCIVVDAMGGDYAPDVNIDGAIDALNESKEIRLVLVGDRPLLLEKLSKKGAKESTRLEVLHAEEVISMEDHASSAMRRKKRSSIHVGMQLLKENKADAFISAGNSGAIMTAAILVLGRLEGVERPAILIKLPSLLTPVILLDAGANVDCKPSHLFQFAEMGKIFAELIEQRKNPKIGILSNGSEETKGNELTRETHALMKASGNPNYVGYVEGYDLYRGTIDIVVCDGFVGNVILKLSEGIADCAFDWFRQEVQKNKVLGMIGITFLSGILKAFKAKFDYKPHGSAPLLGIDGMVFISHGSSNALAIKNGILTAKRGVDAGFTAKMRSRITEMKMPSSESKPK